MKHGLLTLNAGSATLKFAFFSLDHTPPRLVYRGSVDGVGRESAQLRFSLAEEGTPPARQTLSPATHTDALQAVLRVVAERGETLAAVAHRVVHGGVFFDRAIRLDAAALAQLETLIPLAPLHQPVGLAAIAAVTQLAPDLPQIACFDTAFHTTQDPLATRFGIAQHWHEAGVRRYSFHGLSYAAIARQLPATLGTVAEGQVVVLHLGSGSSACVLHHGRSVATSMGMSAAEGLMMGTRPGNLDPEVVLWWMENSGMDIAAVRRELYKASGLLGVSGLSADLRDLLASPRPEAELAIELYCYRAARLGLSAAEIQRDIRQEKMASFSRTVLYQRLFALADRQAGRAVPREAMPQITLNSPKIVRKLTTEWFANRVNGRYEACLARDGVRH